MSDTQKTSKTDQPSGAPPLPDHLAIPVSPDAEPAEDPAIESAVDDITTQEADQVLAAEDAELAKAFEPQPTAKGWRAKIKAFFKAWWNNKKARYATIAGLIIAIIIVAVVPASRYFVLNNIGVRSSASITVYDQSTRQPLKHVEVTVANQTAKTDGDGQVKLEHVKLGATHLVIQRRAFATIDQAVTVGWGSNPYGDFSLKPTGSQYQFSIKDFLSEKPVVDAEVSAGEASAVADQDGKAVLTVDQNETSPLDVTIKANGYRDEVISLNLDDKNPQDVQMVPAKKHTFVSKRAGTFDLYSIDVDGKNEKLLLAGSGTERDDITLATKSNGNLVAMTSSRDNVRNKDGYLLTTLTIVDTKTGQKDTVAQSENIQVIDWIGDRLIFAQIAAGASASDANRMRLISYDQTNDSQKELASSNYFNDVVSAGGDIYYAPSDTTSGQPIGFYRTNADGSKRVSVLAKNTWNVFRTNYKHLTLAAGDQWFDYQLSDVAPIKLGGAPANQQNRIYQDDSQRKNSLWVEKRDGKGVLLRYNTATMEDTVLRSQSGLSNPTYWLNDKYVVYRIFTEQESADYVINLDGGEPRKISNVTNTAGLGNWYYY